MICVLFSLVTTFASPNLDTILIDSGLVPEPASILTQALNEQALRALHARERSLDQLKDPAALENRAAALRSQVTVLLGGFPERTPLNPQLVGTLQGDGFRVEKLILESQPGYFVTAALYLPEGGGPWPGVLVPCGHSDNGKAAETYQRACISLARHGMAALCYDPVGQSERYHFFKDDGKPEFGTTLHHTIMGVGCILTGSNIATYRIWDGIRCLDYLESRPDIDKTRLACTGNSGGGTLTSYIMALDDRVSVAAPSCFLTTYEKLLTTIGPQDAEQNIFGFISSGMDHGDYVLMRAPKPTIMLCATRDYFDVEGTWKSYRQAARVYGMLGHPERIALVEANEEHGFTQPLREGMVQWMQRWLLKIDAPVDEAEVEIFSDEELQCTPHGRVADLEGARSIFDLVAARADELSSERQQFWSSADEQQRCDKIRSLVASSDASTPDVTVVDSREGEVTIERLVISPEPGISLPAALALPGDTPTSVVIIAGEASKASALEEGGAAMLAVAEGNAALVVNLRGFGETISGADDHKWGPLVGKHWPDYYRAYLLGRSFVGMRTDDLLACARYLKTRFGDAVPVHIHAQGEPTIPALHAAALAPELIAHARLERMIPSWDAVVREPRAQQQLMNAVHDALRWYDLPLLVEMCGERVEIAESTLAEF